MSFSCYDFFGNAIWFLNILLFWVSICSLSLSIFSSSSSYYHLNHLPSAIHILFYTKVNSLNYVGLVALQASTQFIFNHWIEIFTVDFYCRKSLTSSSSRSRACCWAHRASASLTLSPHRSCDKRMLHMVLFNAKSLVIFLPPPGRLLSVNRKKKKRMYINQRLSCTLWFYRFYFRWLHLLILSERGWRFGAGQTFPPAGNGGSRINRFKHPWW